MWMTPFYLFLGVLFVYIFRSQIDFNNLKKFNYIFLFVVILSPFIYGAMSIIKTDKRTDYPGREIAEKVQHEWSKSNQSTINVVLGREWKAGNLSYHLKSRPIWIGVVTKDKLDSLSSFVCLDKQMTEPVCVGSR